jgi:glycosyltransferase involved in cell wall biosynthesis
MARGDVVIANSRYTGDLIASRYRVPPQRVEVIHRGVDPDVFHPAKISADRVHRLRERWGVAPDQRVVLQAARLTRWKVQTVLIEAMAQLRERGSLGDAVAILAGDAQGRDSYAGELQKHIGRRGLDGHIRAVGHVDDISAAYLAAHVTVIASTEPEAFGRTAVEAAALCCPVIATDLGAPPETVLAQPAVKPGQITGWLVPPGDAGALADVLARAVGLDQTERAAIGERARRHIMARFTTTAMQGRTLAIYDRLLGSELHNRFLDAGAGKHSCSNLPGNLDFG